MTPTREQRDDELELCRAGEHFPLRDGGLCFRCGHDARLGERCTCIGCRLQRLAASFPEAPKEYGR